MEHYGISKLLNDYSAPKFVTRKWIDVNDLSGGQYSINKNIKFKTPMLRSDLWDYSDAYIIAKGKVTTSEGTNDINKRNKKIIFKNNVPFKSCI